MIYVKYKNLPELELEITDSNIGLSYVNLIKENYAKSCPIFRDTVKYTADYMMELANKAKHELGWDWLSEDYNIDLTAKLHKDLEKLLGIKGFAEVSEDKDWLIHELHYCLHLVQYPKKAGERTSWLQIEWFNDSGFELAEDFSFSTKLQFGDLKLQNPFVGHGPLQIYLERDFSNIPQTCKFHNFVKPGINIAIDTYPIANIEQVLAAFKLHAPEFVEQKGEDRIRHFTGYPVIGKVKNLDVLERVKSYKLLELEYINFDE